MALLNPFGERPQFYEKVEVFKSLNRVNSQSICKVRIDFHFLSGKMAQLNH
jgi:hypothetical protein